MTPDEQIATAYDFSPHHTIMALGANSASLLAVILRTNPHLMGYSSIKHWLSKAHEPSLPRQESSRTVM